MMVAMEWGLCGGSYGVAVVVVATVVVKEWVIHKH